VVTWTVIGKCHGVWIQSGALNDISNGVASLSSVQNQPKKFAAAFATYTGKVAAYLWDYLYKNAREGSVLCQRIAATVYGSCNSLQGVVNAALGAIPGEVAALAPFHVSLGGSLLYNALVNQADHDATDVNGADAEGTLSYWDWEVAGIPLAALATAINIGKEAVTAVTCAATGDGFEACKDVVDALS
jgi:Zn-finger nucleic acid-binding protein